MKMILIFRSLLVRPLLTLASLLLAFFAHSAALNEANSTAPTVPESLIVKPSTPVTVITAPKINEALTATSLEAAPVKAPAIPAKKTANNKSENTPDFIPSEEISEDLVVSFPVDI